MYLDPGSGSLILQIILAVLLGVGVTVKIYWGKIRSLFRPRQNEDETQQEDAARTEDA